MQLRNRKRTNEETQDDAPDIQESDNVQKPKRARTTGRPKAVQDSESGKPEGRTESTRRVRGKRGSLKYMIDMPLDILFDIFVYLTSGDLLSLARTNKDYRRCLMSKESAWLWKAARHNVGGLPELPEDLSEPAYANLMFSSHCHICLRTHCYDIYLECRVRLCKKCKKDNVNDVDKYATLNTFFRLRDSHAMSIAQKFTLERLLGSLGEPHAKHYTGWRGFATYTPQLIAINTEYQSLIGDANSLQEYLTKVQTRRIKITEGVYELKRWYVAREKEREQSISDLKSSRQKEALRRLRGIGWGEEIDLMSSKATEEFERHPDIRKLQPLTSRVWMNIEDRMIKFMEKTQANRLEALRRSSAITRIKLVTTTIQSIIPHSRREEPTVAEALLHLDRIREAIMTTPPEQTMTKEDLDWIPDALEEHMRKRVCDSREHFADQIRKKLRLKKCITSEDTLSLAIAAWFRCEDCNECFTFPNVLSHVYHGSDDLKPPEANREWAEFVETALDYKPELWMADRFDSGFPLLRSIITAYGMDPKTATIEDMDSAHVRLVCLNPKCETRLDKSCCTGTRVVMDWRAAFSQGCTTSCRWEQLSEAAYFAVQTLEQTARSDAIQGETTINSRYECRFCKVVSSHGDMQGHLKAWHNISDPGEEHWYDSCTYVVFQSPVYLVPKSAEPVPGDSQEGELIQEEMAAYFDFEDVGLAA